MKVTESIKELKLILKKMDSNRAKLREYSSGLENMKPQFESVDEQKKQVAGLIQSNEDLAQDYTSIKQRIDYTNLMTTVEFEKKVYTVAQLILIKRIIGSQLKSTYESLDASYASMHRTFTSKDEKNVIIQYFDEKKKAEKLNNIQDLLGRIDGRLETLNAVTELLEVAETGLVN